MKELLRRPVAFHPVLARAFGGVNEALLWQQIHYWSDKGRLEDGWIYKTKEELEEETTLTRDQQDRARKNLEKLGVLKTEVRKANGAPTLHYKVDEDAVVSLISGISDKRETSFSNSGKPAFPLYTESTTHISEQSSRNVSEDSFSVEDEVVFEPEEDTVPTKKWNKRATSLPQHRKIWNLFDRPNHALWTKNPNQRAATDNLIERGEDQVIRALAFYKANKNEPFCPQLSTPYDLDMKWENLLQYRNKKNTR